MGNFQLGIRKLFSINGLDAVSIRGVRYFVTVMAHLQLVNLCPYRNVVPTCLKEET